MYIQESAQMKVLRVGTLEPHCLGSNNDYTTFFLWALGKLLNLFEPPFPHLLNKKHNGTYLMNCHKD